MTDVLAEFEAMVSAMSPSELKELDKLLEPELKSAWLPNPGPQTSAYYSQADILLYGGAAGGGKTDLLLGLALTHQTRTVLFRRAYVDLAGIEERLLEIAGSRDGWRSDKMVYRRDGKLIEMGALEKPGAEKQWQGRAHDFIGFDEGAQLSPDKVSFVLGWLRSANPDQRCRVVIASNPPMGGDGEWLIAWFAPWLDPLFPNPAESGELRWAYEKDGDTVWVDGPDPIEIDGETYTPQSRTFIPARLDDNPYLSGTGYRQRLQNMPEPLRSQLLKGDFLAGREDHEWQVIPTEWVKLANQRWERNEHKKRAMVAIAADVGGGGPNSDPTAIARLYDDNWFAPLILIKGEDCSSIEVPRKVGERLLLERRDEADISVDGTGGWGSGIRAKLKDDHDLDCASLVFSAGSDLKTKDGKLGFVNLRAQMWWQFREALDPETGDGIALPVDPRLLAELTTPRWEPRGVKVQIEDKDDVRKRVGGSTDRADAVVMAWLRRKAAARRVVREERERKMRAQAHRMKAGGWMGR